MVVGELGVVMAGRGRQMSFTENGKTAVGSTHSALVMFMPSLSDKLDLDLLESVEQTDVDLSSEFGLLEVRLGGLFSSGGKTRPLHIQSWIRNLSAGTHRMQVQLMSHSSVKSTSSGNPPRELVVLPSGDWSRESTSMFDISVISLKNDSLSRMSDTI